MNIVTDLAEFTQFFAEIPVHMGEKAMVSSLRDAALPMMQEMKRVAPVSFGGRTRISLKHRKSLNANDYRRGGATKQDISIRKFSNAQAGQTTLNVGVSFRTGKVGWRYHFIALGVAGKNKAKAGPRPFAYQVGQKMSKIVEQRFYDRMGVVFGRIASKYTR